MKQFGVLVATFLISVAFAQGGQGGLQGAQGGRQSEYDRQLDAIESAIGVYLNGEELKSILTPGEHVEWPLEMKVGQVVVAESRSDAFDPALEIIDGSEKVLANNDDRYPGDQRPLLLWECTKDGKYLLRARSFMNKAGGQCFTRFRVYDTMPLHGNDVAERPYEQPTGFLVLFKVPMKAGQIKRIMVERPSPQHFGATIRQGISPIGLPDANLAAPLYPTTGDPAAHVRGPNVVMAPVDGNYYFLADLWGADRGRLRASARDLVPVELQSGATAKAPTDTPSIWTYKVKATEFVQASTPELHLQSTLVVAEVPDVSKFSLEKPESNPFFPKPKGKEPEPGPAFVGMWARARDPRIVKVIAQRDANLWIATNGAGPDNSEYRVTVQPAARTLPDSSPTGAKLQVGSTDYWAFDAKVGDVLSLTTGTGTFSEHLTLRDPELKVLWDMQASPDQASLDGLLIVTKPGRYLAAISSLGDGGGGEYSLSRKTYGARVFAKGQSAQGQVGAGDVQVWKFTVQPNDPLLVRWQSSVWSYGIAVYQEDGRRANLPLTEVSATSRYGILKVNEPTTFLIVLTGERAKADYKIDLTDLPGT